MGVSRWIVGLLSMMLCARAADAQMTYMVVTPYGVASGAGYGSGPLWNDPYYGGGYYYDPYVPPVFGGAWTLPPVMMPAESMYGPQVMKNFMGLNQPQAPIVQNNTIVTTSVPTPAPSSTVRSSNAQARQLAAEFIRQGDEYFHQQRFNLAYERYKTAQSTAPDVADATMRQGFALTALGQYGRASEAFKRGLALDDEWPRSTFRLSDLYANNNLAKTAMFDALATEANRLPEDGDLLFVLGVSMYFDADRERARPFFEGAKRLAADPAHLDPFLAVLDELARSEGRREL